MELSENDQKIKNQKSVKYSKHSKHSKNFEQFRRFCEIKIQRGEVLVLRLGLDCD